MPFRLVPRDHLGIMIRGKWAGSPSAGERWPNIEMRSVFDYRGDEVLVFVLFVASAAGGDFLLFFASERP